MVYFVTIPQLKEAIRRNLQLEFVQITRPDQAHACLKLLLESVANPPGLNFPNPTVITRRKWYWPFRKTSVIEVQFTIPPGEQISQEEFAKKLARFEEIIYGSKGQPQPTQT